MSDLIDEEYEYISIYDDVLNEPELYFAPNPEEIQVFLGRMLSYKENRLIYEYLLEKDTNIQIKLLHQNCMKNGLYSISKLTKNNGDCLFESLSYLGYGKTSEIRKNISALLLSIKNDCNFFSTMNTSPEEIFLNCNDVELIKDEITGDIYEYDYDMMVCDLYENNSWTRLPMQLILMTISRIYEIEIKIFSNSSTYINTINMNSVDTEIDTVYLGHINEEHYIPIIKIDEDLMIDPILLSEYTSNYPIYTKFKRLYNLWCESLINNDCFNLNNTIEIDMKETEKMEDFYTIS